MYACMHVCMYVCMYVCLYVCMYIFSYYTYSDAIYLVKKFRYVFNLLKYAHI